VTKHREEWRLDTRHIGGHVLLFEEVESTNTLAVQFADDPRNDGVTLLTDVQNGGRGQYGRTWHCPPRSGVLMSVLLFPPLELRRPALLTAWAAVSVCETLWSVCSLQAQIKWPNDVLVRGRKVCGILIECGTGEGGTFQAVVGLGLNLNQTATDFETAGLPQAGSLRMFTDQQHNRDDIARRLLRVMDEEYDRLLQGDLVSLESLWKWRVGLLGKTVQAECLSGSHQGRLLEMGWDGLCLEVSGQMEPLHVAFETVRALSEIA
jgi:BirA family biotin operon repressor/biotin-[acetyl-CoA-carboxylase] ligase